MLAGGKKSPKNTSSTKDLDIDEKGDIKVPTEKKKKALQEVVAATKKQDWPAAIAQALASGSKDVISALAKRLEKEGLAAQAKDLRKAYEEMVKLAHAAKKRKAAKKKPAPKPKAKTSHKAKPKAKAKASPKPAAKPKAKPKKKKPTATVPVTVKALPPATPKPVPPTVREGSRSNDVKVVQEAVGATPDGIFGPKTKAAVIAYQSAHGLVPDGIVGPKTWTMILYGEAI